MCHAPEAGLLYFILYFIFYFIKYRKGNKKDGHPQYEKYLSQVPMHAWVEELALVRSLEIFSIVIKKRTN